MAATTAMSSDVSSLRVLLQAVLLFSPLLTYGCVLNNLCFYLVL